MASIEIDWPTWNALPAQQQQDIRDSTGLRLGTPVPVYNGENPVSVFWSHPRLTPEDIVYVGVLAGAAAPLVRVVRDGEDSYTAAEWPVDPETGQIVRTRADVRTAARWWHRATLAEFRAEALAAPEGTTALDIAVTKGHPSVDDGRRDRITNPPRSQRR